MRSEPRSRVVMGSNPGRNRAHNRRVVLEVLRTNGPTGRTRIADMAQLSSQAVTQIIEELVNEGLVKAGARLRNGRGQPPIQFAINRNGPMTVGIEIAADHITMLLTDLTGTVRAARDIAVTATDPAHVIPLLRRELDGLHPDDGAQVPGLLGIGVVMPGPFEVEALSAAGPTTLPGWNKVDPVAALSEGLGMPIQLQNDATAAAVGERLYGAGLKIDDFCLIYLSAGLGLGIIQGGRPTSGAYGNAGEIGHLIAVPGGRPCSCGQQGCLEQYASLVALSDAYRAAGRTMPQSEALCPDDPVFDTWARQATACLRPVVAILENILDPQCIILSSAVPDQIIDRLIHLMHPLPVSVAARENRAVPRLLRGSTGRRTAALGAAALPLMHELTPVLQHVQPQEQEHTHE
ncbi:ROK family transcriptional regulator [Roseinatronobacter alkalisoli]|uniref:ROK family protein n=1 Tax=Roseinatronobacter alkalisoli TaxID=3028235 RepID=A0ABT5TD43_9RHOB|nr:ROK family transcriptional regulator [Roseinatronobacter sp. HJB301]MDD7973050.1 ROK family protein [Roseinatronobacter sp. HJB301]